MVTPIIQDHAKYSHDALKKLETCRFRSKDVILKTSCCSSNIKGFRCELKNIYPLSFERDCKECTDYLEASISPVSGS